MSENRCIIRASKRNMSSRKGDYASIVSHNIHDLDYGKQELLDNLRNFFENNDYNSMENIVIELIEERNKLSRKLEAISASDLGESKCMPKFTCEFSEIFDKVNSLSMEKYFLEMENKRLQGEVKELHDLNIKRLEPLLEKVIKCPHCHSTFKYSFDEDERFNFERFERMSKTFNKGINTSTGNICYIPVMENGQMTAAKKSSIDEDINDGKRVTEEWLKKIKHSQKSTKPYHMLISDRQRKNRNIKMLKAMYKANAGNKIDPETIDYIINETGYEGQLKFTISIEELSPIIMHHKFSNRGLFALKALIDGKAGWKVFPTRQQIAGVRADTSENPLNSKLSSPVDDDQGEFSKTLKDLTDESNESSKTIDTVKNEEA